MRFTLHVLALVLAAVLYSTAAASAQCAGVDCVATPAPSASPTPIPIETGNASDAYATLTTFISKLTNVGSNILEGPNGTGVEASALTAALMGVELGVAFFVFFWGFKTLGLPIVLIPTIRSVVVGCFILLAIQGIPQLAQALLTMPCYMSNTVTQGLTQHTVDCTNAAGNDFAIISEGVRYSGDLLHVQMKDAAGSLINPFSAATDIVGMVLAGGIAMISAFIVLVVFLAIGIAVILAKLVLNAVCFIGVIRLPWLVLQSVPLVRDEAMGTVQTAIKTSFGLLGIWIAYGLGEGLVGSYFDNIAANGATLADLLIAPLIPIVWLVVSAVLMWLLVRCAKGVGFSVESVAGNIVRAGLGAGLNVASGFAGAASTLAQMGKSDAALRRAQSRGASAATGSSVNDDIQEAKFTRAAMLETRRPRALGPGRDDHPTGPPSPSAPPSGPSDGSIPATRSGSDGAAFTTSQRPPVSGPALPDDAGASSPHAETSTPIDAVASHVKRASVRDASLDSPSNVTAASSLHSTISQARSTLESLAHDAPPAIRTASISALRSLHVAATHATDGSPTDARVALQQAQRTLATASSAGGHAPQTMQSLHDAQDSIADAIANVGASTSGIQAPDSPGSSIEEHAHITQPVSDGANVAQLPAATTVGERSVPAIREDAIDVPFRAIDNGNSGQPTPSTSQSLEVANMRREHLAVARAQLRRGLLGAAFTLTQGMHDVVDQLEGNQKPSAFGTGIMATAIAGQRAADVVTAQGTSLDTAALRDYLAHGQPAIDAIIKRRSSRPG